MTRILLVDEVKVVNYAGGIEKVLCDFSNEFVKRNYTVDFLCLDLEKGQPFYELDSKVNFVNLYYEYGSYNKVKYLWKKLHKEILRGIYGKDFYLKNIKDPKRDFFENEFISRLSKYISSNIPNIIICASGDSAYFVEMALDKLKLKIPYIVQCHIDAHRWSEFLQEKQLKAWKNAALGQVLLESYIPIIKQTGIEKVIAIPNIVWPVSKNDRVNLDISHNTIASVGRVEKTQKRHYLLIEAFAKVAKEFPDWKVKIYGEIDDLNYKKELEKMITENNLGGRIVLCGVVKNIKDILKKADIFAFPSAWEGFPLALTEAMSVGLPAIGYKSAAAVNELIENNETGFLVNDGIEDFADKLNILIKDKDLRIKFGKNAVIAMQKYSPKLVYDKWEIEINTILNKFKNI